MKNEINIGIVGAQFMGRAHSNAWSDVKRFYNLPVTPVLKTVIAENRKKDNHDSFQKIFERYSKPLFQFSLTYLKSKDAAEDVVQEVFIKIWNNRRSIKTDTSFQSDLLSI